MNKSLLAVGLLALVGLSACGLPKVQEGQVLCRENSAIVGSATARIFDGSCPKGWHTERPL